MNLAIFSSMVFVREFTAPALLAQAPGILVMIAAAVLVYRTYRERYLAVWIFGWLFYFLYRMAGGAGDLFPGLLGVAAASQAAFVVAVTFFVSAVLFYTSQRKYLLPIAITGVLTVTLAVARTTWFPDSDGFMLVVHLMYRVITLTGAVHLALFCRGRRELGPWLMTVMLLFLHMDERNSSLHTTSGLDTIIEVLFGISMLVIVLDDSRGRAQRLQLVNALTTAIAEARDYAPVMVTALEELKKLTGARAAWFRLLQGDKLLLMQHIGLSPEFLGARGAMNLSASDGSRLLDEKIPTMLRTEVMDSEARLIFERSGFDHVIMVPVSGKNSVLGFVSLGMGSHRSYTQDELSFLITTANQLGIAVESLRMFEQVLRSQKQWVGTFDSIEDLILVHDAHGQMMTANRAMLRKLGRKHDDIVQKTCAAVLPNAKKGCPYCRLPDQMVEAPDPCFGGFSIVSTSSFSEEGDIGTGTVHVIRDTTERRAAEERYRLLFEEVQEGVFISTPDGCMLDCNDAFVRMLGYQSRAEVLALDIPTQLYHSPLHRRIYTDCIAVSGYVRNYEVVLRRKDGSRLTVLENSFASRDAAGNITRYQGFLVDITEKKRAEDEIRRRNRELHVLNAIAVIATHSFDLDEILNVTLRHVAELFASETGSILLVDPETRTLRRRATFGHRSDLGPLVFDAEMMDEFWTRIVASRTEVVTQQHLPHMPAVIRKFVEAEGLRSWIWIVLWSQDKPLGALGVSSRCEREFAPMDENLLVAISRQLATTIEKVRLYEETTRAYEDLRRTQEQLLQSEKMSAVGQLISGVAHELNNPLTAILGYAQLMENEELNERSRDFVQKLYKQAQRTHRVVQNLLSFARQRKPVKQHCDLRRVLEDTLTLRDYDLKLNNIAVQRTFEENLPAVIADAHQMEQVFLNIINNSSDAILEVSRGGQLSVRLFADNGQVCAEFRDTGPGIMDAKRIFDPFYTTKKVGKGTGLGLSICYGIVKEHGGDIVAFNNAEGGAVFQVRVPSTETVRSAEEATALRMAESIVRGRVILVDDEESILEFEREVLVGAGAEVVAVTGGEEAIARLQSDVFDAILIDGKMPGGWTAPDIYRWVRDNRPGMERRIIVTMSHASDGEMRAFLDEHDVPCIVKPFEVTDLLAIVRRVAQKAKAAGA
ncbi:MAG TPA: GAF domain-containing protein [Clostridia bacterium]|nr:GAF domain-containing protein [Clostridia bacterium]